jgi:ClpP class serine protease
MLITAKSHAALRAIVESKLAGETLKQRLEDSETDIFGDPLPKLQINGNVAVVPVYGPIVKKAGMLEKVCGICGTNQIMADINTALSTTDVDTIAFDVNSPGGTVTGVPELAEYIRDEVSSRVRTIAYTDDLAASAAFYIAVACKEFYAAPTADILSVGVYNYYLDVSKAYEKLGVEVKLFTDGALKGMGIPGTKLTKEQEAFLDAEVKKIGTMFRGFVKGQRPSIPDEMLQGQCLMAYEVEKVGGIDGLANNLADIF